jgi:hypothetical protein
LLEPELEPDVPEPLPAPEPVPESDVVEPEPAPEPPEPEPGVVLPELEPDVPTLEPLPLVVLAPLACPVSVPPKLLVRIPVSIPVLMPLPAALPVVSIAAPVPAALFMSVVVVSPDVLPEPSLLQAIKNDKAAAVTKTRFMLYVLKLEIRYCCDGRYSNYFATVSLHPIHLIHFLFDTFIPQYRLPLPQQGAFLQSLKCYTQMHWNAELQ